MVVVGGSAITCHLPGVYTSDDIDLAVISGIDRRTIDRVLAELGFLRRGRDYAHAETRFTIDIVAETPYIDRRAIQDFVEIETPSGTLRTYRLEDAIADRVAAFLHWNDSQSLEVGERSARAARERISEGKLAAALDALEPVEPDAKARLRLAQQRLTAALSEDRRS